MRKISVAIDGYSSCGKSTMAKALAKAVGYVYVDTGAMYRAVTLYAIRHGLFNPDCTPDEKAIAQALPGIDISFKIDPATGRPETYLCGEHVEEEIRSMEVSGSVSPIAALPCVRRKLVETQQAMGRNGGVVMDGRDVGTTVLPGAELKVFVTASVDVRARRRYNELVSKGVKADLKEVADNVRQRDYIDTHREVSPLRRADDALILDNSDLTVEGQMEWLLSRFKEAAE